MEFPVTFDGIDIFLSGEGVDLFIAADITEDFLECTGSPFEGVARCFTLEADQEFRCGGNACRFGGHGY